LPLRLCKTLAEHQYDCQSIRRADMAWLADQDLFNKSLGFEDVSAIERRQRRSKYFIRRIHCSIRNVIAVVRDRLVEPAEPAISNPDIVVELGPAPIASGAQAGFLAVPPLDGFCPLESTAAMTGDCG